jgi:N-acyl-D-amino-acid deacylase
MWPRFAAAVVLVAGVSAQTNPVPADALFAAIRKGAPGDVERALASGISANSLDTDGTPALMAATLFGDARLVDVLLAHRADPNVKGPDGMTALMWAADDVAKARSLLDHGADVNAASEGGRTALLIASSYPRTVDVIRLLLDRGANLRAQDRPGATALALAARSADVDVVRLLVDRGLDPAALGFAERRAAFSRWDRPTTDFLMAKAAQPAKDLLPATATWQPPALVARWLDLGADVNAAVAAQYGRTALMNAVASEAEGAETVRLLLDRGADPNARMTEGETALDWAIYKGDREKILLLEQHGGTRGAGPRRETIPAAAPGGIQDARLSLTKSVAQLLPASSGFRDKTNCISCHHNGLPAMAASVAKRKGIPIDEAQHRKNLDDQITFFKRNAARVMSGDPAVGGEALTVGYTQLGLAAAGYPADTLTTTMTHWLLARQMPDGSWLGNGLNRPPLEYSLVSHTAMATGGLKAYPIPGRRREIDESLRRAQQWLLAAQARSAEERGMRLMGLVWTGAPAARVDDAINAVRVMQDAVGGWSQFSRTASDAYATGLSLYALHLAGVPVSDAAYRKGVAFLLATQYQDGAWLVRTHSFPVQRYFESGFPFGRHQWISAAGTSWAALAIAQTLPDVPQR